MKKRNLFFLILILVIGFASVSTTLILNGTLNIGFYNTDFDVVFTEASLYMNVSDNTQGLQSYSLENSGLIQTNTLPIESNGKSFSFTTDLISEIGRTTYVDYTIKNKSTNYDSTVTINCGVDESANALLEYISIEQSLTSPFNLASGEEKHGRITIALTKPYTGNDEEIAYKCTLVASPVERDTLGKGDKMPYTDPVLNGADPEGLFLGTNNQEEDIGGRDPDPGLADDMVGYSTVVNNLNNDRLIPVTISNDGEVTYADVYEEWYNYTKKEWANAVILNDGATHTVGDIIPESDIESYFVWVPRFKYQIFDEGNYTTAIESTPQNSIAKEIQIEFENKKVVPSRGTTKDSWLTHPAFTNFNVNGFWVGKFETGYKDATTKEEAEVNEIDSSKIVIKPNTYSWRNSTVSNMFKTAYKYKRVSDSHMMKNTEWGAVAYLSHSKYGINTEVRINNNSNYLTGYSAADGTDQSSIPGTFGTDQTVTLPYNTETGYKASTTGNITGIYDMSGGTWEYVAAYMPSSDDASGFTAEELTSFSNYLDVYPSTSTKTSYNNRILGDATGEMGPFYYYKDDDGHPRYHNSWYTDDSPFLDSTSSWFGRGGFYSNGARAGQFLFNRGTGQSYDNGGFRVVLGYPGTLSLLD